MHEERRLLAPERGERLFGDLVAGTLEHPYSRQLLASSKGYSRAAARLAAADPPQVDGP